MTIVPVRLRMPMQRGTVARQLLRNLRRETTAQNIRFRVPHRRPTKRGNSRRPKGNKRNDSDSKRRQRRKDSGRSKRQSANAKNRNRMPRKRNRKQLKKTGKPKRKRKKSMLRHKRQRHSCQVCWVQLQQSSPRMTLQRKSSRKGKLTQSKSNPRKSFSNNQV